MANYPSTTTTPFTGDIDLTQGGKAGIGTTAPATDLHAYSATYGTSVKLDVSSGMYPRIKIEGADGIINRGASSKLYFGENADSGDYLFRGTGKLGIGTTTPAATLDVNGGARIDGSTFVVDSANNRVGIGTTAPSQALEIIGHVKSGNIQVYDDEWPSLNVRDTAGNYSACLQSGAGHNTLAFSGQNSEISAGDYALSLIAGGGTNLHITTGAKVGIGTTSPGHKLEVNGSIKIGGNGYSLIISNPIVPNGSTDSYGEVGQLAWDSNYLYIKISVSPSHSWKRIALSSW